MSKYSGMSAEEIYRSVLGKSSSGQGGNSSQGMQQKEQTGTTGGKYSGMSADDIYNSVMGKLETDSYKKYQSWVDSADTYTKILSGYTNRRNGAWTKDTFAGNQRGVEQLLGKYNEVSADLDDYDKGQLRKRYNQMKGMYDSYVSGNEFYSKFRDQDDYDRNRSGYGNFGVGYAAEAYGLDDAAARKLRQEAAQKDAQEAQRALAEYTAAKKEFERVDSEWQTMDDRYRSFTIDEYDKDLTEKWQAAKKRMTDAENSLLGARNRMDAYNATWGKVDKYGEMFDAAKGTDTSYTGPGYESIVDWENKKNEEQAAQDAQAQRADYVPGTLRYTSDTEPTAEDRLGLWRSLTPEQKQDAVSSSNVQLNNVVMAGNDGYWDLLTDNEVETYYYIKGQQGQEAANQYLDDMYIELFRRNELNTVQSIENAGSWEKAGLTAVSVGANLVGAIPAALGKTADLVAGRTNPYSSMQFFQRYASYIRGSVGQDIGDWTESKLADKFGEKFAAKAGNLANQTFQALMSGVDSMAGAMTFGQGMALPAGPFDFHVGGYTTVMGLGAFAQRAQELELKGATPTQIAIGSIGSGILEALFEDVSMEVFFTNILNNPAKTAGEFVKKLAIQMGVEGSEEMFTEMGNIILDAINMGKNSENSMAVREYMGQGMTEEEAKRQVWKDNAVDILWAGYGGAISAGAMAAGGQLATDTVRKASNTIGNYSVGDTLTKNGRYVDLQEQANALQNQKKGAKLAKAAQEVAQKASAGDKSIGNKYRMGKVATQIAQQAGREASKAEVTEFRAAAEKYLAGQRDIQNKKHALNVLTRAYEGTTMVPGDRAYMRMIQGDKLTQNILDSIGGKETLQENAKAREAASMRTAAKVQGSVLGLEPTQERAAYDSDNSGQAYLKDSKDPVNIRGIAEVKDGRLYVSTDEGQTVKASDVSFGSYGEAAVYSAISNMHADTQTARSLLAGLDSSGMSTQAYATALQNAYNKGMSGVSYDGIQDYSYAAKLSDDVRRQAWQAGRDRRAVKTGERAAKVDSGTLVNREKGLTIQDSAKEIVRDSGKMNEQQKAGVAAAKVLAEAGLHIEVYASTESERQNGAPNGIYRGSDGTIHIDLNAGDNGQGTVAYALAHETTHFIKDFSPAKYQTYADILIEAAESKGISYDSLLDRQLARLSELKENRSLTAEELQELAYDETIAEMSETMLTDTDAAQRVSQELYKQDRTLWEKIKDFFTGLVEKLRNAYKGVDPDSDIGRVMKRAIQDNEKVAQAWAEAVVEAGENYQLQDGTVIGNDGNSADYLYSNRVTDKKTLDFLDGQETVTTYKTMQLVDGKLYPPMAAVVAGSYEDYSELGKWEAATEHPELIKLDKSGKPKFTLNKGKGQGSLAAAYNPYMHSSNLVLNDQFSGAYTRPNLVTVECRVPVSELTSGYKAQYAKDSVGWHSWHTGTVAGALRQQTGTERQVLLSRWIMPVRIVPNAEVAQMYKQLLDGTDIAVPDNVVPPALLTELKKAGVAISESGRIQDGQKNNARGDDKYSPRMTSDMTEQERYDKLKDLSLTVTASVNQDAISEAEVKYGTDIRDGVRLKSNDRKKLFQKIASIFGVTRDYRNQDIKLEFGFSNENLSESLNKQKRYYYSYLKMLSCFENVVDSAIGIETHNRNEAGYKVDPTLKNMYVLVSAFQDGENITPVKLEIKEFSDKPNTLYVAIALDSIQSDKIGNKKSGIATEGNTVSGVTQSAPPLTISLADLFANVNPQDSSFLKYVPTQFLTEQQRAGEKYSYRNNQESQVERLARKNEELKAEAEYLKQVVQVQKRGNSRNLRDRESVNAIAKSILESVNAKDSEFGKQLNDFYRDLVTVEMDYDTMQEKAGELADRALEHHQAERDGYAQDILDFLKKRRVRLSDGQIGDIEYSYGSLNDFKRAIKGSIILDQNAETSLYQLWQEAAAQFPDRFGADTVAADMPDGIANVVAWANSAESSSETEFQYYKAETKADLTQKILMGFLDAKPVESVSDTLKKQMAELKEQHQQEMKELRKSWDEEAKAMEQSHKYDLEAERKRGKAAVEALKYQQEVIQKAQKGLWETERADIKRSYEKQMQDMEDASDAEMKVMQQEFFRVVREWEKSGKTINELQKQVKELQKGWEDEAKAMEVSHQYDLDAEKLNTAMVQREFNRLLKEYDASDRKVDRLEAKVKQQRETAEAKVESRKKTEERHKLQNTIDTLNRLLLKPTNTAHVPQELQSSVATALDIINQKFMDSKSLENAQRIRQYAEEIEALERRPAEAKAREIESLQNRIDRLLRENNKGKNDSKIAELNKELLDVRNKQEEVDTDKIAELNRKIKNLTGKDTSMKAALTSLQEQYRKLEGQEGEMFDSNIDALIEEAVQEIGNTAYKDLSLKQLKAVRDAYTALLTTIRNTNKMFMAWQDAGVNELVKRATMELSLKDKKKPTQTAMGKKIDQFFWNNEKPVYAFERIGSAVMSELYNNLRKGEDTFYRDVNSARDFFLGAAEKNGFDKWNLDELQEFEASNGQKFQLSLDERMSLYAYSLRPQARDHLTKGGIVLAENTKRLRRGPLGVTMEVTYDDANAYTLTDETIDAIVGSLTKEQRQFAYEMQQYLAKVMGAKGDEVNMALYGIKKFGEETYWPLKSSGVFSERIREQQERTGNKVKNSGFTKALTQHANNAIELSSLTETWAEHVNDMSMYHAFTLPMEDFYRVYNWTQKGDTDGKRTMGVRQMIQQTAGKGAVTYIDQFLKDLNGGLRADPRETVEKALVSSFKKAAVGASLSVAIQQPSAVGRAFAYIEANYFLGGKVESAGGIKQTWDQLKKYAAVAGLKEMGRFDVDMGQSTLEYIIGRHSVNAWGKFKDKVDEYSGWLPEMADQVTWCAIWEAAKRKTAAQNPGLKGEALLQKAGELFTDTITRTQVYDSVFSRSSSMRAKTGLMSMVTSFMAEPTTTANMVEDAVRKFARGDKRMAGKVMSSVAVATVLNAALASVVYAARDDDEDKTYWEKYLASLAGETVDSFNPLTYIPVLADINNLLLGYSIERTDMALASDLVTDLKKIYTLYKKFDPEWSDEKKEEWKKKVRDAWLDNAWMVGTVMGLPLKNVVRDVEAVINTAKNPSNGAEMSADTVLKAMKDSARKNFPILSWKADESSSDQLYKAITQGKDVLARRLKAQFGDEKKYESALLKGLRENDPRIKTAAQYALDLNTPKRVAIIREIVAEGHYTQDQVIKAINQKALSMKEKTQSDKDSPPEKLYDYSEYVNAAANGLGYAGDVQKELIRYQADRNQEADGKLTRQEAESDALKTFKSNVKGDAKDGYAAGELTEAQARKVLEAADIAKDEELDDLILQWDTELELGREIDWGDTKYLEYAEEIRPAGISVDVYDEWLRQVKYHLKGEDEDGDGEIDRYTAVKQKAAYINDLPLTAEQKDALFATVTDSARTRRKYKLW